MQVVHLQDLDVEAELGLVHGEVRVHVEHPGVGVSEEPEATPAKRPDRRGGVAPLFYLLPGVLVVIVERSGDDVVRYRGAFEGIGDLGHATGRAVREPLACIRILVIQRGAWLEVQDDHWNPRSLDRGQDLRTRCVGGGVAEDEIHPLFREPLACSVCFRGSVDETGRDDLGPPTDPLLDAPLVAFQPLLEAAELSPVGFEPDAEDADLCPSYSSLPLHPSSVRTYLG